MEYCREINLDGSQMHCPEWRKTGWKDYIPIPLTFIQHCGKGKIIEEEREKWLSGLGFRGGPKKKDMWGIFWSDRPVLYLVCHGSFWTYMYLSKTIELYTSKNTFYCKTHFNKFFNIIGFFVFASISLYASKKDYSEKGSINFDRLLKGSMRKTK